MNQNRPDTSHRLGVALAAVCIIAGIAFAFISLIQGATAMDVLKVDALAIAVAILCYVVARIVGVVFGELLTTTREHRARRS